MKRRHSFEPSKTCKRFIQMATGSWKQREVGVKNMRRKTRADLRLHEKATILEIGEKGGKAAGEGRLLCFSRIETSKHEILYSASESPQPKLQRQANNRIRIFFPRHGKEEILRTLEPFHLRRFNILGEVRDKVA